MHKGGIAVRLLPYAILDMDGTLLDTSGMWDLVSQQVLGQWGVRFTPQDRSDSLTMTIEGAAAYFVQRYRLPASPRQVAAQIRARAGAAYAGARPKPGVEQALDALAAHGVKLCVASGTEKALVDAALAAAGLSGRFAFTLDCQNPEGKASPEVYLRAMRGLGAAAPGQVMVFEDSLTALRTAKAAGFVAVGVYDEPSAALWPQIASVADALCPSWAQWAADIQEEKEN